MLDAFRQKSRSTMIYLMFAAVIIIFAFGFGAGGSVCNPKGAGSRDMKVVDLAEVDGNPIDTQLLTMASELSFEAPSPRQKGQDAAMRNQYYRMTRFYKLGLDGPFSGGAFNGAAEDASPIQELKVLDELIETRLVASYGKKLGMSVSDEEMNTRLARLQKNFQNEKTGEFQKNAYLSWLGRLQTSVPAFESFVKDELLRERVIALLVGEVNVTDAELEAQNSLENEKVKVEYISVDKSSARPLVPVTDDDVAKWLAANEQKVKDEYEKKKANEFTTPQTFILRKIQVDAPDLASAADPDQRTALETERKAARAKIDKALSDLKAKLAAPAPAPDAPAPTPEAPAPDAPAPVVEPPALAAFAEIAKAVSDDATTKDAGGKLAGPVTLPELGRGPWGPNVAAAAPNLKPLEPSEVLEADDAFYVIMVESVTPEVVKPLDDVKTGIAKSLLQEEKVADFMKTLGDEVKAEADKNPKGSLEDVAKAINTKYSAAEGKGLQKREAEPFARIQAIAPGYPAGTPYIFGIGKSAELVRAAFAATTEAPLLPAVFKVTGDKLIVARLLEKTAAEKLTDDAKTKLRERLTRERQRDLYRGWYADYRKKKADAGELEMTSDYEALKKQLEEAYVSAGGLLPGMTAPAAGASPAAGGAGKPNVVTIPVNPK